MGQKVHPHGLRVGVIKEWDAKWFANKKDFADNLVEDNKIREFVKKELYSAGISKIEIERAAKRVKLNIYTAKPGVVIGKGGSGIEALKAKVMKLVNGKNVLKSLNKFYATDLGVKKIKTNSRKTNYSQAFENIIYNELINKGYNVYVGKTPKGEIDFIASKNEDVKYIQACYDMSNEETRNREFNAFIDIDDSYPKYVISKDTEDYSRDGIKHINIFDFLMNDDF